MNITESNIKQWSRDGDSVSRVYVCKYTGAFNPETATGLPLAEDATVSGRKVKSVRISTIDSVEPKADSYCLVEYTLEKTGEDLPEPPTGGGGLADVTLSWRATEITEVRFSDKSTPNPKPFTNTMGELLTDLPELHVPALEITITRKVGTNPIGNAGSYCFKTNSDSWFGIAAGKALIIDASGSFEGGIFTESYTIAVRADDWKWRAWNTGYRYKAYVNDGPIETSLGEDGNQLARPVFLDQSGEKLTANDVINGNGYKLEFVIYDSASFGSLNLPNPFQNP